MVGRPGTTQYPANSHLNLGSQQMEILDLGQKQRRRAAADEAAACRCELSRAVRPRVRVPNCERAPHGGRRRCGTGLTACSAPQRSRPRPSGRGCSAVCAHVMATNRQRRPAVAQPCPLGGSRRRGRVAIPRWTTRRFDKNSPRPKCHPAHRFLCFVVRLVAWPGSMAKMRKRRRSPVTRVVSTTATR